VTAFAAALARKIADEFETARIPYAIGGAIALGVWGFPRATNDVDVDVFVSTDGLDPVFDALERVGCTLDREESQKRAVERGDFRAHLEGIRIDVFVPSIPLYESAQKRRRVEPLEGRPAWFLSPEDLAVFKMLFFRTKDLLDVERLVAFMGGEFDRDYVARWLTDLVGEDDERLSRWAKLLSDVDCGPDVSD